MQRYCMRVIFGAFVMMSCTATGAENKNPSPLGAQHEVVVTQPLDDMPTNLADRLAERNPIIVWYNDTLTAKQRETVDHWRVHDKISLWNCYHLWHKQHTGAYGSDKKKQG